MEMESVRAENHRESEEDTRVNVQKTRRKDSPNENTPLNGNNENSSQLWKKAINKSVVVAILASIFLIVVIAIILTSLAYDGMFTLPTTRDTQEYTSDFTIGTDDYVVVPNNIYPKSDNIIVNVSLLARSSFLGKVNLYKVNRTLPLLSKPISINTTVPPKKFDLLDYRYVLEGTTLDITLDFTTEEPCSVSTYMFDNHESFADFNRSLRYDGNYRPLLPHRICMNGNQRQPLISNVTTPYYSFTIINIELEPPTTLAYHINGTQTYYNASGYPVSCTFPQGSNKYCSMTTEQSQDMILALTTGAKQDNTFEAVDLHYNISVYSESVQHMPVYVAILIVEIVLIVFTLCGLVIIIIKM